MTQATSESNLSPKSGDDPYDELLKLIARRRPLDGPYSEHDIALDALALMVRGLRALRTSTCRNIHEDANELVSKVLTVAQRTPNDKQVKRPKQVGISPYAEWDKLRPKGIPNKWPHEHQDRTEVYRLRMEIVNMIQKRFMPLCVCDKCEGSHAQAALVERIAAAILRGDQA